MILERWILVYVVAMITRIILVMRYDAASQLLVSARFHQTLAQNILFQHAAYFEGLTATTIAMAVIVLVTFAFVLKAGMSIIWRSARSGGSGSSAGWWRDIGLIVLAIQLLPVPQMIADACLWVMQLGIGWLVAETNWFSERPYMAIALPPPGSGWLYAGFVLTCCCLVVGRNDKDTSRASLRGGAVAVVLVMVAFWVMRPVPDAVLFARTTSQLVIAADMAGKTGRDTDGLHHDENDTAFVFSLLQRSLSDFLAGNTARVLGVQMIVPARTWWFREIDPSGSHRITVVLHRGALSDACKLALGRDA